MSDLPSFPAADLARNTGNVLDAASRSPVTITKHRKPRFVLMSYEHYTAMASGMDQQAHTLDDMPEEMKTPMVEAIERDLAKTEPQEDQPSTHKTIKLRLSFWVENNSKFVRGKKKTYEDIENFVLYPYTVKRHGQGDYTLTVTYKDDQDLDDIANAILTELHQQADLRHCFVGDEMIEVVGDSDRYWN